MPQRYVYIFGAKKTEGNGQMRYLLGGKGTNLAEMARLGIPAPAGFTISTEVCAAYYRAGGKFPSPGWRQLTPPSENDARFNSPLKRGEG